MALVHIQWYLSMKVKLPVYLCGLSSCPAFIFDAWRDFKIILQQNPHPSIPTYREGDIDFGVDLIGISVTLKTAQCLFNQWLDSYQIFMDIKLGDQRTD